MASAEIEHIIKRLSKVIDRIKDYCNQDAENVQPFLDELPFECGTTAETLFAALDAHLLACGKDEEALGDLCSQLDTALDELHSCDFFGTEGQCDPRGDFRDDSWSLYYVQGVDEQDDTGEGDDDGDD